MNGTKVGVAVISAEVKSDPDWCHGCGVRQRAFAILCSWENAEHAFLGVKKEQRSVYRRYCGSCVKAMSQELSKAVGS